MLRHLLGTVLVAIVSIAFAQDASLERARQLLQSKQPKAAYALLSPLEQERAGDPQFDYLLGIAALDAGQLTRAVFALERVLAVQPDHPQARAEIARAYFLMGENRAAREEFEAVKQNRPPEQVSSTIDKFLDALDARERARGTGLTGFLEATLGHDSNANAATATTSFAIPIIPGLVFNLAPASAKQPDDFWALAGGVSGRYALNETIALVGNASFDQRMNSSLDQFDTGSINASGGASVRRDADEFTGAAQFQTYDVDRNRFREAAGLVAQWRRTLGVSDQVTAYVQHTRLTYPSQTARNANRTVVGGAWAHAYSGGSASFAGIYAGKEDPLGDNAPQFGHDLWGGRVGGQVGMGDKWILSATLAYEDRKYGGPDPFFAVERHDRETQLRLAASYLIDRRWSVNPAITRIDNRSNVVINEYDRTIVSVSLRYDFR
jgi:tetratricopeptide (TPR) repeat protein